MKHTHKKHQIPCKFFVTAFLYHRYDSTENVEEPAAQEVRQEPGLLVNDLPYVEVVAEPIWIDFERQHHQAEEDLVRMKQVAVELQAEIRDSVV